MIRFYLDEDLPPSVAEIGRASGVDVVSSHEVRRNGLPDHEQLRWAAAEGRCLVTRNRDDFLRLNLVFLTNGWPNAGILIVNRSLPTDNPRLIARALSNYVERHVEGLPSYMVDFLSVGLL